MYECKTNGNLTIPRKNAISRIAFCALGGLLLIPCLAQAASVTINLGQAAQNFIETGAGANGSGLGQWFLTQGTCTASGGNTTCILSGSFTGTATGYTEGTYSLATTYTGTGSSPFEGTEESAGSNYFTYTAIPGTATMTLTLNGTTVIPILSNSQFASGASIYFLYNGAAVCSGTPVSPCTAANVSLTSGAVITGTVTGGATFNIGNTYYFSQLAFSGGYQTVLTYVNYSAQTVTCVTNFYSDAGAPLPIPFSQGTISTRTDVLPPGQSLHDISVANLNNASAQGWGEGTCTGPVQASVLYRYYNTSGTPVGEASVNGETTPTTEFVTFAQTATGVAYGNPSTTQSATITLAVVSSTGTLLGTHLITLGPLQHGAANLGPLLGLSSFTGSVQITSTSPIISLSLNAEVFPVFSSLPPGDLPAGTTLVE